MTIKIKMDAETQKNIDSWLEGSYDEATKNEIRRLQRENPEELTDAFFQHLDFGTGGLRGLMGVGTNRMNAYTVRAATQGLANYLATIPKTRARHAVLVGYDTRNHSKEYAEEVAKVFAANEIEVFLYKEMRPVALISYGVLHNECIAGVMITASHNPKEYNGYKVWWKDGVQVLPPHDQGIIAQVNKIKDPTQVKVGKLESQLVHLVSEEIDNDYVTTVRNLQLHPGDNRSKGKSLHIVYTSIHGGGITMVPRVLSDWGFGQVTFVDKQCNADGNFPTVKHPNPEEPEALQLGIDKLKEVKGDLLLATDPDCDRLAVAVAHHGKTVILNGNETACLALEHICKSLEEARGMPAKAMFIKTIVTTELFKTIVEHYRGTCLDVLTGFKYIGEKIAQWEEDKKVAVTPHHYVFVAEESYGSLFGTHARDKDAVVYSAIMCESALQLKKENKTLVDELFRIYHKYGVFREKMLSWEFEGREGIEKIKQMMETLRKNPPKNIGGVVVTVLEDYLNHTSYHLESNTKEALVLPKSNVLRFWLSDHTKIVVRPSGTEPKIKVYCATYDKHFLTDEKAIEKVIHNCDRRAEEYLNHFKQILKV